MKIILLLIVLYVSLSVCKDFYVAKSGSPTNNGESPSTPKLTIQGAINVASAGDTVHIAPGLYIEHLVISKDGLTIIGDDRETVIIESDELTGYGISISADNVKLQYFTLDGTVDKVEARYGIKPSGVDGFTAEHLDVRHWYRTGLDVNGCTNTVLNDIKCYDNDGFGIAIVDSQNVELTDIYTSNNEWGGINIATWGRYHPIGVSGVKFIGTGTSNILDFIQIEEGDYNNGNPIPPSGNALISHSYDASDNADVTFKISDVRYELTGTQDDTQNRINIFGSSTAANNALSAPSWGHFTSRTLTNVADSMEINWYVDGITGNDDNDGLGPASAKASIQAGIDEGSAHDTIHIAAATYPGHLSITQDHLTLLGDAEQDVIIAAGEGTGYGFSVRADYVHLKYFTLVGEIGNENARYGLKPSGVDHFTAEHLTIRNWYRTGLDLNGCSNVYLNDIHAHNNNGFGLSTTDGHNVTFNDISTDSNDWGGFNIATWGNHYPLGTSDISFTGTNHIGDFIQIEEGDYNNGNPIPPTGAAKISIGYFPSDNAQATFQLSDVTYNLYGDQDDTQVRINIFATKAKAEVAYNDPNWDHFIQNANKRLVRIVDTIRFERYVNASSGNDANSGLSPENAMATIQACVNSASELDVVHIANGEYVEKIDVEQDTLTIIGESEDGVIINSGLVNDYGNGLNIKASGVVLEKFTVLGDSTSDTDSNGIYVNGGLNLNVSQITIKNCQKSGLVVAGTTNVQITDVHVQGNLLNGISTIDAHDVLFTNITTVSNGIGVEISTLGKNYPIGTSGIVFRGANSIGSVIELQMNDQQGGVSNLPPTGPARITYSTGTGNPDVMIQYYDVVYALLGTQKDGLDRVHFFPTEETAVAAHDLGAAYKTFEADSYLIDLANNISETTEDINTDTDDAWGVSFTVRVSFPYVLTQGQTTSAVQACQRFWANYFSPAVVSVTCELSQTTSQKRSIQQTSYEYLQKTTVLGTNPNDYDVIKSKVERFAVDSEEVLSSFDAIAAALGLTTGDYTVSGIDVNLNIFAEPTSAEPEPVGWEIILIVIILILLVIIIVVPLVLYFTGILHISLGKEKERRAIPSTSTSGPYTDSVTETHTETSRLLGNRRPPQDYWTESSTDFQSYSGSSSISSPSYLTETVTPSESVSVTIPGSSTEYQSSVTGTPEASVSRSSVSKSSSEKATEKATYKSIYAALESSSEYSYETETETETVPSVSKSSQSDIQPVITVTNDSVTKSSVTKSSSKSSSSDHRTETETGASVSKSITGSISKSVTGSVSKSSSSETETDGSVSKSSPSADYQPETVTNTSVSKSSSRSKTETDGSLSKSSHSVSKSSHSTDIQPVITVTNASKTKSSVSKSSSSKSSSSDQQTETGASVSKSTTASVSKSSSSDHQTETGSSVSKSITGSVSKSSSHSDEIITNTSVSKSSAMESSSDHQSGTSSTTRSYSGSSYTETDSSSDAPFVRKPKSNKDEGKAVNITKIENANLKPVNPVTTASIGKFGRVVEFWKKESTAENDTTHDTTD